MTLREQVAAAIARADKGAWEVSGHAVIVAGELDQADAAIGVVLAVLVEQIEALPGWSETHGDGTKHTVVDRDDVLAVVARLGGAVSDGD